MSLYLKCYRKQIVDSCIIITSANLFGIFNPFPVNVITDVIGFMFVTAICFFLMSYVFLLFFLLCLLCVKYILVMILIPLLTIESVLKTYILMAAL